MNVILPPPEYRQAAWIHSPAWIYHSNHGMMLILIGAWIFVFALIVRMLTKRSMFGALSGMLGVAVLLFGVLGAAMQHHLYTNPGKPYGNNRDYTAFKDDDHSLKVSVDAARQAKFKPPEYDFYASTGYLNDQIESTYALKAVDRFAMPVVKHSGQNMTPRASSKYIYKNVVQDCAFDLVGITKDAKGNIIQIETGDARCHDGDVQIVITPIQKK